MPTTINISLPDSLKTFVDNTVAANGYGTTSEYLRELIRADQKKREQERLEQILLKSLESGETTELSESVWDNLKAKVRSNLEKSGNK